MRFKRDRKRSRWLVQDLYLRDTWGKTHYVERPRRMNLRRVFVSAMLIFGVVDVFLAGLFVLAILFPARVSPPRVARRPAATALPTAAPQRATQLALRPSPTRLPTRVQPTATRAPTEIPLTPEPTEPPAPPPPSPAPTLVALAGPPQNLGPARTISVPLPETLPEPSLSLGVPPEPVDCTPAAAMRNVVTFSIKLCPGQTYAPFLVRADNTGVFGNPGAVIQASGRGFGIIIEGAGVMVNNVTIRATVDGADASVLLCLYPDCNGRPGGVMYGGGILVRGSDATIMGSDISGGVTGVAAERVRGLKLINNRLDNSSGWGSYNFLVDESYFVGNSLNYDNRSCTTPDGGFLPTGCESAGWACIACQKNTIAANTCTNSGDCYYINGEGNLQSNNNKFHRNECRASPHNCFEVTFSLGNEFVENIARSDPDTGTACKYPFWVGGSRVIFRRNQWSCTISPDTAIRHATDSTSVPTQVETYK